MNLKKLDIARFGLILLVTILTSFGATNNLQGQETDVFEEFTDDYQPNKHRVCATCPTAQSCETGAGTAAPPWLKFSLILLAVAGGAVYVTRKLSWKVAALMVALVALGFIPKKQTCTNQINSKEKILLAQANFPETEEDVFEPLEETTDNNEFETFSETDEFQELPDDEFSGFSDETTEIAEETNQSIWSNRNFTLSVLVLLLTLLAGILVRFKRTRKLKTFMLLGTIIYLGFINGACPCMISSFQNTVMYLIGTKVEPVLMLWFLGLIPLTYFFGKVWCGWVCHLGALQEFIFRPGMIKVLQNRKSQLILKWFRVVTLAILLVQIVVTRTNIFIHYDPFKVAYNLFSANTLGYVLLAILLISSLLIYRPFCRAFCPVGLILGWVSHIPGAARLNKNETCVDCKSCSSSCKYNAMTYENRNCRLNNEDCILCGDCMDKCKFKSIEITGITKK